MSNHGHYLSIPGFLSRRGVLDVGLKCPHACSHCFTREPERASESKDFERNHKAHWRPTEQLVRQVELMKESGFVAFDITGGEPTLHPGIVDVVAAATRVGLASRIITLGQHFERKDTAGDDLLTRLLDAGLTDMRFSYHAADATLFHKMTGGNLLRLEAAMSRLDELEFQYTTNTTITEANYRTLPAIARALRDRNVYTTTFLLMMSHYAWADWADKSGIRARYADVAPYLREAVDILEAEGIAVTVRYAPLCTIAGLEKNHVGQVGVRMDSQEWMNAVEHSGPGDAEREARWLQERPGHPASHAQLLSTGPDLPPIGRGTAAGASKLFAPVCQQCSAMGVCDGIDPSYLDQHGDDEFVPYCNIDRGHVLDNDRIRYIAGHIAKLRPDGDPAGAVRRWLKPEQVEPDPLVSVVVANYNHGDVIGRCLDSLNCQTYRNIGVVIVDDASTDDSEARALEASASGLNVKFIRLHENSGRPSVPRNIGVRSALGSLVMVLDPDDYLEPSAIEEMVRHLRASPWASIVYPGLTTFGMEQVQWVTIPFDPAREIRANFIPVMSLYRRSMFDEIGGYDEDTALKGCEDWNFWVSAVRLGHFAVPLPRQLVHYCRSETGIFETEVKGRLDEKSALIREKNDEVYPASIS